MSRFPSGFVDRLRQAVEISSVIGARIPLTRKGREFQACCPFHKEKTPSFTVNDMKGFYHCFGCGAHGDIVKFLMDYERLSFSDAVEKLAGDAGIPVPEMSLQQAQQARRAASQYDVLEASCQWFEEQLQTSSGALAREYLAGRGVGEALQRKFRIGFAPARRDGLREAMGKLGTNPAMLVRCGLLIQPDQGVPYDRFRGRIMFPICDGRGKVIAFGGRAMGDAQPKYLNSPETELFHKSHTLYALHQARKAAHDCGRVVAVEGYMDVIALHQAGMEEAVAPLGTALTEGHLKRMWQLSPEPVICLDGDAAGLRAMQRIAELALPLVTAGKTLRFAMLPEGEDPDTLVRGSGGAMALREVIERAQGLAELLWRSHTQGRKLNTPEQRAAVEAELAGLCEKIQHAGLKRHYEGFFRNELWAAAQKYRAYGKKNAVKSPKSGERGTEKRSLSLESRLSGQAEQQARRREYILLALLLHHPQLLENSDVEETVAHMQFSTPTLDILRRAVLEAVTFAGCLESAALMSYLKQEQAQTQVIAEVLGSQEARMAHFASPAATPEEAWEGWVSCKCDYEQAVHRHAEEEAASRFAQEFNEDAWKRLVALKAE